MRIVHPRSAFEVTIDLLVGAYISLRERIGR